MRSNNIYRDLSKVRQAYPDPKLALKAASLTEAILAKFNKQVKA